MLVLKEEKQAEITVKKSKFITYAKKCSSLADVKKLVEQTRAMHPDCSHVVHAAVIGNEFSFSDDKEPKNTAGRPAFEVLKGSGISNICVLVVRYFGGTLLGTGGLVKAYSDSVKAVLDKIVTEELVEKTGFEFYVPYTLYENTRKLLESLKASDITENFEQNIKISGNIPLSEKEKLGLCLAELSNGQIKL